MKRKLLIVVMAIALTFSCCAAAFAAVPDGSDTAQPYNTSSMSFTIQRTSSSTAEVSIDVILLLDISFETKIGPRLCHLQGGSRESA